jgi:hypothetical protein
MILARRHSRRGAAILYMAVSLVALASIAAVTIDIGMMHDRVRHVSASADASALSGAADLYKYWKTNRGEDPSGTAAAIAKSVAAANGYPDDGVNGSVVVNIPPKSGPFRGEKSYIEVIITKNDPRYFSRMFSQAPMKTTARAVARGSFSAIKDGIIVLDTSVKGALNAHGGGNITITGDAPVIVNSTHTEAAITNGSNNSWVGASQFYFTGGYTQTGSSMFTGPGGTLPAPITTGSPPTPDPLSYLPQPDPATLPAGTANFVPKQGGGKSWILTPGVFEGGLSYSGKDDVTLLPGIYYMKNGGFSFSGQGSLFGRGVMIYNAPASISQNINITGQGIVDLSPMTTGMYAGILFFQDRTSTTPINVVGSGGYTITGTFYAANAPISVSGNGDSSIGSQFISRTLDLGGNGTLNIDYNAVNPPGNRILQLVE